MGSKKSISSLQEEIKKIEKKKKDEEQRKKLEERLKRLKAPSKPKRIGSQERVRRGLGKGVSGALDRASSFFFE